MFKTLQHLPRPYWAAIGRSENGTHLQWVENFEDLLQRYVGEGGVAGDIVKKNNNS